MNDKPTWVEEVFARLDKMESVLLELASQRTAKEWYSTDEIAKILGKAEYTVREWCRQGRIKADKKGSGRGKYQGWAISNSELLRFQKEGLLRAKY